MGNIDKIIKENIEAVFIPLLEKLLNISIKQTIELKDKLQVTIEREPDFLKKIIGVDEKAFILHLEFQSNDDAEMVYRMAEYRAILQRKYRLPVRQFVIYLGARPPKMRTELYEEERITGFELKNINSLSIDDTLDSQIPEEIVLAILTDYPKADAEKVVVRIIEKLQKTTKDDTQLRRAVQQLLILSRLRNLEEITTEKAQQMPITYDITKDGIYQKGVREGLEKGVREGLEKGVREGEQKGSKNKADRMIIKALQLEMLSVEQIAEMAEVDVEYVLALKGQLEN